MIKEVLEKLSKRHNLKPEETRSVFNEIMSGKAQDEDIKEFLLLLAQKKETTEEIIEAVKVMRERMTRLNLLYDIILDTCGTGGGESSFNVSTCVALVSAGAGVKVAKHGNRSYTSHCGSADILERVGVKIDIPPRMASVCIEKTGMVFLYAPLYHTAMKYVAGVRKKIQRRTIFNILGPLSNPAGANAQLIGTFTEELTEILANVLGKLGTKRAFIVHSIDGFDEVSISDKSVISELNQGRVLTYQVQPEDFGVNRAKKEDVACRNLEDNISILHSVLEGKRGPQRDMVLINTSLALLAAGLAKDLKEGVKLASWSIDSGRAKKVLESLIEFTNRMDLSF